MTTDAQRIRIIRAYLGLTSQAFADRLGVCAGTLTSWERGRNSPQGTKKDALWKLCQEEGIGFTPNGFPLPIADVMQFKPAEEATSAE